MDGDKTGRPLPQESVPRYNKHRFTFAGGVLICLNTQTISGAMISLLRDLEGIGSAPQIRWRPDRRRFDRLSGIFSAS
jgi:hypothetical protein